MSVGPGSRLGPYEITAKLGEGGMGEVYRATDTKLERQVAIKVLPAAFTEDKERLARFEREAKLLAQLHHPNIASIFGLEESEGTRALVMELVDGPTLAERLEQGALPFHEGLSIALQIAQALEEAHEKGIVHRDLKPQNIKASTEGRVKVLDFGLAKAMDPAAAASGSGAGSASLLAQSPTLTLGATQMGVILGTAAYMAPEQAKGMAVDKRADIWAFGVVLWEMLTGRSLFAGDSVPDTLARVLQRDVDFDALPPTTPPAIRRLVRRCLERNPKNRLHDIADARIVLDEVLSGRSDPTPSQSVAPVAPAVPLWRRAAPWAVAAAAAAWGVWATLSAAGRERRPASSPVAFTVPLRELEGRTGLLDSVAVSRDGRRLAIHDTRAPALFVRDLASFEMRQVPGTAGAKNPFLSPDGAWLGFNADSALKKVALAGGDPVRLCDAPANAPGATWGPDGFVYFTPSWTSGLWRVSEQGGRPERLTVPDAAQGESGHYWPSFLPDGRAAVITLFGSAGIGDAKVGILELDSWKIEVLGSGARAFFLAPDQLVLFRHGAWIAMPFDPNERRITGPEMRVLPDARPLDPLGDSQQNLAVADNGLLAYVAADGFAGAAFTRLAWFDRTGHVEPLPFAGRHYSWRGLDLSPDERRVAVTLHADGGVQVWLYDLERGTKEQLTRDGQNFNPAWHPDGKRLGIASLSRGSFDIFLARADGGAPPVALLATEGDEQEVSWSDDGRSSVFVTYSPETGKDVSTFADGESGAARAVIASPFDDDSPRLSPDGRWLSYRSQSRLYVTAFPGDGERIQISEDGSAARWSPTTPELFYLEGGKLVALRYEISGGRFRALEARPLFELPGGRESSEVFDLTRDAQRFLFLIPEPGRDAEPGLRVLMGGFAALRDAATAKP